MIYPDSTVIRLQQSMLRLLTLPRLNRSSLLCIRRISVILLTVALAAAFSPLCAQSPQSIAGPAGPVLAGTVMLSDHVPRQITAGHAVLLQHYPAAQKIRLAIALKHPHMAEEEAFLRDLQDPNSPHFHQYLTADQWNARFSPSAADEQAVVDWAASMGFTVTHRFPNRLLVDVEAPSSLIERAFNVTMNSYQLRDEVDYSNDRNPLIPARLSGIVTGVLGLNNIQRLHASKPEWDRKPADYAPGPAFAKAAEVHQNALEPATDSTRGPASNFTNGYADPTNIYSSQAYNYDGLYHLGHCCNPFHLAGGSPPEASIAIAAWGDFSVSDLYGFQGQYPYLAMNINGYYIDGQPSGGPNGETLLDAEWSMAMSNSFGSYLDTAHILVYMAGSWSQATNSDVFNAMLSNGYARVFTTSWSCTEDTGCSSTAIDTWHGIFNSMLGQGWTLLTASGDRGATDDCYFANPAHTSVAYPASDPDVVGVGGTFLSLNASGNWASESGWQGGTSTGSCANNNGGSGGGQSVHFARPSYQSAYTAATGRLVPDISLNAGGIGQNFYFNGALHPVGGTSIGSPEMAGFFAQENAYLLSIGSICVTAYSTPSNLSYIWPCGPYGQPHYALYHEGLTNYSQHNPYYDITTGCNSNDQTEAHSLTSYCAHSSYDLVTGWGAANMMQLAWSLNWGRLANSANGVPYLTWTGPTKNKWYNTSQTVSWTVNDFPGNEGPNGTGIAGFWQAWDQAPSDPTSAAHGGSGNLFYSGPQYANAVNGCLSFVNGANGCAGGVSQGCHTAYVIGWNNEGFTTAYGGQSYSYGPICYDYTPPVTGIQVFQGPRIPRGPGSYTITLTPTDQHSGVAATFYYIYFSDNRPALRGYYKGPLRVKKDAATFATIYFYSWDNANNAENYKVVHF